MLVPYSTKIVSSAGFKLGFQSSLTKREEQGLNLFNCAYMHARASVKSIVTE